MSAPPLDVVRQFVSAVAWGEHRTVWELLGQEARTAILRVATRRGMDDALAARLRDGIATATEEDVFLTDLINGMRADFAGTDLDELQVEDEPGPQEPDRARVLLIVPVPEGLGVPGLPVGSMELSEEDGTWRVQRVTARNTR
ncbi:MAG: hypothetical protein WD232_07610 [Acidimicrobiales bacterium]